MKFLIYLSFLLISTNSLFADKELTEYGKWLKYYKLEHNQFIQTADTTSIKYEWGFYNVSENYKKIISPLYFHSPNGNYMIDIYSYSLCLDQVNGKIIYLGREIDSKVQLLRNSDGKSIEIMFCGTSCYPETVRWLSNDIFIILGFSENDSYKLQPTKWLVDLSKRIITKSTISTSTNSLLINYIENIRLKELK